MAMGRKKEKSNPIRHRCSCSLGIVSSSGRWMGKTIPLSNKLTNNITSKVNYVSFQWDLIPPHLLLQQGFGLNGRFLFSIRNSLPHTGQVLKTISLRLWSFFMLYEPETTWRFSILSSILSPLIWSIEVLRITHACHLFIIFSQRSDTSRFFVRWHIDGWITLFFVVVRYFYFHVVLIGFEPMTHCLWGNRSAPLS